MQPKKKFGQHFLHEKKILDKIIDAAKISLEDHVLEIGPGLGVLTDRMVHRAGSLTLVEIDDDLIPYLNQRYGEYEQVKLIHGDVLKIKSFEGQSKPFKLVTNLPYQITSPLLYRMFDHPQWIGDAIMMLQLDIVSRMMAHPGNKTYGALSVLCQYYFELERVCKVSKGCFNPPPKVESAVIKMVRKESSESPEVRRWLRMIVKKAFMQRRKTLHNTLKSWLDVNDFDVDGKRRPESMSLDEFVAFAKRSVEVGKAVMENTAGGGN